MDLTDLLPARSAEDILAGRAQVTLAGQKYELPVLKRGDNRRWKEQLDSLLLGLLAGLQTTKDAGVILGILSSQNDNLAALLRSYDKTSVIPADIIEEEATDVEVLYAVLEVWAAANPLVGLALVIGAETTTEAPTNGSGKPPSSPPQNTAGRRARSKRT